LALFAGLFGPRDLRQIGRQLCGLTRALGPVRTLDVNLELLRTVRAPSPLLRALVRERRQQEAKLRRVLRTTTRIEDLITGEVRQCSARQLLKGAGAELTARRQVLRKRLRQFRARRHSEAFHGLRIAAKKYRYALESARAVFPKVAAAPINAIKRLQNVMGDCHDAEVARDWLRAHKELDGDTERLIKYFDREQARQFERAEKQIAHDRRWLKKVKLNGNP
jgi:CHAD domain-containing protein